jgi:formylglycine-generating enzyme required for sulfatase activity
MVFNDKLLCYTPRVTHKPQEIKMPAELRTKDVKEERSSALRFLCLMFTVALSSCLRLSPMQEQTGSRDEKQQTVSPPQSKRVVWKSLKVGKQVSSIETSEPPQDIAPAQTGKASQSPDMVLIPAGEFLMGSKVRQGDRDENPQHKVYLDAYYIDKHEVTNAQYHQFWLADGGEKSKHTPASYGSSYMIGDWPEVAKTKPNYPLVGITWYDARAYAEWAGKRLPTEAEWEKAARGTEAGVWPWGNEFQREITMTDGANQNPVRTHSNRRDGNDGYDNTTAPVGSYPTGASPYGVHDMAGNVWEWVADWYNEDYYATGPAENPGGPDAGKLKVVKGGSWNHREHSQRCANRYYCYPDSWGNTLGFRCAKSVTSDE